MFRKLYNLKHTIKIKKNLLTEPLQTYSTVTKHIKSNDKINWSSEQEHEILQLVNSSRLTKLLKFIQPSYAEAIISNRKDNGHYESLNDFLSKNKINYDMLNEFYTAFTRSKTELKQWKKLIIKPCVTEIEIPKTILGLHIGYFTVSWALLSNDCKILDWDYLILRDNSKADIFSITNFATLVLEKLPLSHCYVLENIKPVRYQKSLDGVKFQIFIAITSCLQLIRDQRKNNSLQFGNLYILKHSSTEQFFNLTVYNEVIATDYVTKILLGDTKSPIEEKLLSKNKRCIEELQRMCTISNKLREKHDKKDREGQELMGWSLLKALTFVSLVKIFSFKIPYWKNV